MLIGALTVSYRLEGVETLKAKRQVVRGLLDSARNKFRIAAAEVEDLNLIGNVTLGFAAVSNDRRHLASLLQHLKEHLDSRMSYRITDLSEEVLEV